MRRALTALSLAGALGFASAPAAAVSDPYLAAALAYVKAKFGIAASSMKDVGVREIHACRRTHACGPRNRAALMSFSEGDGDGMYLIFVEPDPAYPARDRYVAVTGGGGVIDAAMLESYGLSHAAALALEAPCDRFRCNR